MPEKRFGVPDEVQKIENEMGDESKVSTRTRSREAALRLKMAGASFAEIAKTLEFTDAGSARAAVERALIDNGSFEGDKENMRALLGLTLDQWHRSIAPKILNPAEPAQLEYMAMGVRLLERKARLFGLDAPTKIEMHNASNEELQGLLAAYEERLGVQRPVEGNPFELVEGDDGVWVNPDGIDVGDDDDE